MIMVMTIIAMYMAVGNFFGGCRTHITYCDLKVQVYTSQRVVSIHLDELFVHFNHSHRTVAIIGIRNKGIAFGNFHDRFLKGKVPVIFCPKLDQDVESYIEKMARILSSHTIRSITVVRMVVPCCGGTSYVVKEALARAGKDIPVTDLVISLEGNIL